MDEAVVLITGGAQGQGAAEARAFATAGAKVAIADVRAEAAGALAAELGPRALAVGLDVRDAAQWDAAVAQVERELGPLTALVNNAGVMSAAPLQEETDEGFRRVVDVNLTGAFLGIRAAGRAMRVSERGRAIVNVSSTAGLLGARGAAAYTASKWGLRGLTQTAAAELAPHGIRVSSIHPGLVSTDMLHAKRGADEVLERWGPRLLVPRLGTVDDVAAAVLFLVSDAASYVTGAELVVDGGLTAWY